MKVVIDTNILISALLSNGGPCRDVLRLALRRQITPVMGAALYTEYEDVLSRDPLFAGCALQARDRAILFDALMSVSQWTKIHYLWRPNLRDEDDNHLVELAIAAGAGWIITENIKDLSSGELIFDKLGIARAMTFLEMWETKR